MQLVHMSMFVTRIWSSNTTHPEYDPHRVVTSLSIKLKCANILEVQIKLWPAESNDLMNQAGQSKAASDRGGISGWWLHEWSLAVTAANGWQNPSGQHVLSSLGELNTDRRLHPAYTYTHYEHWEWNYYFVKVIQDKDGAKLQSRVKINSLINYTYISKPPTTYCKQVLFCQGIFYSSTI